MPEILIAVSNKIPVVVGDTKCIVADNSDYIVRFSFDGQWQDGEKTVYFVRDDGFAYPPVRTESDAVPVPRQESGGINKRLYIGVAQGESRTTRPAGINVLSSITDMIDDDAVQPDPSLWEDVIARLDELEKNGGGGGGIAAETDPTVPEWAKQPKKPTYTASEVGADPAGAASGAVSVHNTSDASHNDIRLLITGLTNRLNALANSTDEDLDQLAEIVAYIKANKSLIDSVTTNKVSVTDIIDNLTTSVSNKPLSAKMGVELKKLVDAIEIPTALPASDVYDWAKAATKPRYTASEVGALPASTKIPAKTSDLTNDSGFVADSQVYAKSETYSQTEVDGLIDALSKRLEAVADSDDVTLDQLSEIVAYIKANKSLIDSITTSKVSVSDIVDNLTTGDSKKPLSAAQGKALKALYDAIPAWAKESSKPSYSKSDVGLGNVDNVKQYSASNPPPYPVKSVNGKTGAVTLGAADVGAATTEQLEQLSKEIADKISKTGITLGLHSDGKYYIFVDGAPVGTGFELSGNNGDVFGYVDQNNNIVLNGNLADGSYSIKYEMEDGSTVDIGDLVLDSNVYYSVTNNLTNCTNSNSDTQAIGGQAYTATITANSGYELKSVTVTMGGNPVTVSGGNINIASVTGNIIITAVAEVSKPPYTNLADPTSNDWKIGRLGSDGSIRTDVTKAIVTNFISATAGDIIRVSGCNIQDYHMAGYDAGKNKVFAEKPILTNKTYYDATTLSSTYAQIEIKADIALVRFTCTNPSGTTTMVVSEDIIITKNEPIV